MSKVKIKIVPVIIMFIIIIMFCKNLLYLAEKGNNDTVKELTDFVSDDMKAVFDSYITKVDKVIVCPMYAITFNNYIFDRHSGICMMKFTFEKSDYECFGISMTPRVETKDLLTYRTDIIENGDSIYYYYFIVLNENVEQMEVCRVYFDYFTNKQNYYDIPANVEIPYKEFETGTNCWIRVSPFGYVVSGDGQELSENGLAYMDVVDGYTETTKNGTVYRVCYFKSPIELEEITDLQSFTNLISNADTS